MFSWEAFFITKKKTTSYTQLFLCLESIDFKQKSLSDYLSMPFIVWYSTLKFQLLCNCWSFYKAIPFCRTDEEDMDPLVTPHTLSAAMKVDSAFLSSLLPGIQCNLSASLLQLRLVNHLSCLGKGMNLM